MHVSGSGRHVNIFLSSQPLSQYESTTSSEESNIELENSDVHNARERTRREPVKMLWASGKREDDGILLPTRNLATQF